MNEVVRNGSLSRYDALVFPGGFSYGDYVRAGAIWGKGIIAKLGRDLEKFVEEGRPVLGVCNGFQVLVEGGVLPGFEGTSEYPEAALAPNTSIKYECRWVRLKHENSGNCVFTTRLPKGKMVFMPVAHVEGRFIFPKEAEGDHLRRLYDNDQLVFRYVKADGSFPEGEAFDNPNGAWHDIAGICNPEGNVLGMMPHPERAYYGWLTPNWTSREAPIMYGDGRLVFESVVRYVERKF